MGFTFFYWLRTLTSTALSTPLNKNRSHWRSKEVFRKTQFLDRYYFHYILTTLLMLLKVVNCILMLTILSSSIILTKYREKYGLWYKLRVDKNVDATYLSLSTRNFTINPVKSKVLLFGRTKYVISWEV